MKVLCYSMIGNYFETTLVAFRKRHPEVEIYTDYLRASIGEIDILMGASFPPAIIEDARSLKLIITTTTGVNHLPLGKLRRRKIRVANSHGNTLFVAERAVAMLLALLGRVVEFHCDMHKGLWHGYWAGSQESDYWCSLRGKTVGIMGTGALGGGIATLLRPFGCRIIGFSRTPKEKSEFDSTTTDLDKLIQDSNIIVVTLPLTGGTRGIIDSKRLSAMEGKYLINVGRGPVIDEKALYEAMVDDVLAGAAIDTWYTYPEGTGTGEPSRFPIHKLNNVILSPHVGSFTLNAVKEDIDASFNNLGEFISSGNLVSEVNLLEEY